MGHMSIWVRHDSKALETTCTVYVRWLNHKDYQEKTLLRDAVISTKDPSHDPWGVLRDLYDALGAEYERLSLRPATDQGTAP